MSNSRSVVENTKAVSQSAQVPAGATARSGANPPAREELHQAIAVLAYQFAERRNFEPGHEMEDWLNAESEVLAGKEGLKGFPA